MPARRLDREIVRRVRRIEIVTRKAVSDALAGQYHSVFKGRGISFSEVRPYTPGDEVRTIDWNVTARTGEPFVKVFHEERELTVMLVVDVSASSDYGSRGPSKAEVAAELCAQIAFSAIDNGDRVGLVLFSDRVEKIVPPRKGRRHALRIIADVLAHQPVGRGTDIAAGLAAMMHAQRRSAVVFLLSDFLDSGYEPDLRVAAVKHDVVPVVVRDPLESAVPRSGMFVLEDPETGARYLVDTSDPRVRRSYSRWAEAARTQRQRLFRQLRLDAVELRVGEDNRESLGRFFALRARRSRS
jgi:uncharacterized protein (DUF58 family)